MRPAREGRRGPGCSMHPRRPLPPGPRRLGHRPPRRSPTWQDARDPRPTSGGASCLGRSPRCPKTAPASLRGRGDGRLRPRRTSPPSRPGRPSSRSSSSGATSWRSPPRSREKGRAPTRQTGSRTGRRPCRLSPCAPNGGRASFSRRPGWPGQATSASRERPAPPTGTRRPAGGSRGSSTPTTASTEGAASTTSSRRGRGHRGAQDRPHHGRGGARGPGRDEAKAALQLPRGRGHGTPGQQGQAGLCGGASQLPVAHGRDTVLGPRRQALPLPCPGLPRQLRRELGDVDLAERRDGQLDAGSSHRACRARREGPPHRPQRLRTPLPVARVDSYMREERAGQVDVKEGTRPGQLPHGRLLREAQGH